MSSVQDGPSSSLFIPMAFEGNVPISGLTDVGISNEMALVLEHAPSGACIGWGIPFEIGSSNGGSGGVRERQSEGSRIEETRRELKADR